MRQDKRSLLYLLKHCYFSHFSLSLATMLFETVFYNFRILELQNRLDAVTAESKGTQELGQTIPGVGMKYICVFSLFHL